MARIVVFDSGFGSLSIIKAIQKKTKSDIIYFADQKSFPYGTKSIADLKKIIKTTITNIKKQFKPDLIVMGSNTPSILLQEIVKYDQIVIGVLPPLTDAQRITNTKSVAILATKSVIKNKKLDQYIKENITRNIKITKINISELVDLVESGKFIYAQNFCRKKISSILKQKFLGNNVDVATLSSTHLPFLSLMLSEIFPRITFLDPAEQIAEQIIKHKNFSPSARNSLKVFSSGDVLQFQRQLKHIGIKNKVNKINF